MNLRDGIDATDKRIYKKDNSKRVIHINIPEAYKWFNETASVYDKSTYVTSHWCRLD